MIDQIKDKIKDAAMHYWTDHKAAVIIVAVVLIIAIIKQVLMNIAELFKKNFVLVPVIASVLFGTFTGVKYIVNLTDTINQSEVHIVNLERDLTMAQDKISEMNTRLSSAEATWQMAENLYRTLADQVREHSYDIKDLNR